MTQFGCAQAWSGVTRCEIARDACRRNGPPEAVSRMRRTPAGASPRAHRRGRHWKIALCSLSIGSSVAPPSRTRRIEQQRPAITSASLLASSSRLPARAAASVERRPAAPTIAAITASTSGSVAIVVERIARRASTRVGSPRARNALREPRGRRAVRERRDRRAGSARTARAAPRALRCAASATTRKRSGWRAIDVERGLADRSGGAEDGDAASCDEPQPLERRARAAGAAAVTLSMRSSTPPWPGNRCRCP